MGSRLGRFVARAFPALLLVSVGGGFVYFAIRAERADTERRVQAERAVTASRDALFARGRLGEMLSLCHGDWSNLSEGGEPVALAWTRQGVDAFFHLGADRSTLRLVHCNANGVSKGPRVNHPLHAELPAEAPPKSEKEQSEVEWRRALEQASSRSFEASDVAYELVRHPVTGRVLSRRWRSAEGGAVATVEPKDAPAFALLVAPSLVQPAAGSAPPPLEALEGHRWTAEAETAFAFLETVMPKGSTVSELRFEKDEIELRIQHPTPAFDGAAPAPYGDKTFDEYAVADTSWWYPRTDSGFGCAKGLPLLEVHAKFIAAKAVVGPLASAWYSCSTAYSDGRSGAWHLVPAS
jgi:hypothetical protein